MAPEVLLFDLGGVLVEFSVISLLRDLRPDATETELYDRWLDSEAVAAFERGEIEADAFADGFVREWRVDIAPDAFLSAFAAGLKGPFPGAGELLERLRNDHVLACLSNCNTVHWPLIEDFTARFDHAFVSHLCGLVKPDPAVFAHVLDSLDRPPEAVRYFDDSPKNVRAAQAAGIDAYHTVGFAELQRTLGALGLPALA